MNESITATSEKVSPGQLADMVGIARFYHDWRGQRQDIPEGNRMNLLKIMGFSAEQGASLQGSDIQTSFLRENSGELLPSVCVVHSGQDMFLTLLVPEHRLNNTFRGQLALEGGQVLPLSISAATLEENQRTQVNEKILCGLRWPLPQEISPGYHLLTLKNRNLVADTLLIVAPPDCYQPACLKEGKRLWGVSLQLYSLKTAHNWGIGDLTDLEELVRELGGHGADIVTINPLHSLFLTQPEHCSPYSPSSRMFNNPLYIDVMAVEGAEDCHELNTLLSTESFQNQLSQARKTTVVDYPQVTALKLAALRCLYRQFVAQKPKAPQNAEPTLWQKFQTYCKNYGEVLDDFALFEAVNQHLWDSNKEGVFGWHKWPEAYKNPRSKECQAFLKEKQQDVEFYKYLQWIFEEQFERVQQAAREAGMRIGICRDLPVGIDSNGADIWSHPEVYVKEASTGAPPDQLATQGQSWGLPPFHPYLLRKTRYREFIELLEDNMTHCGALRIDHIMGLYRQWWTPIAQDAECGAYISYPFQDLLGILKLESHRNRCMVIGEDLGIVPEAVCKALPAISCYGTHLAMFCQDHNGFFSPEQYRKQSLVCFSNHDVPTLKAWWECQDIDLLQELNVFQEQQSITEKEQRHHNKVSLLHQLNACGELPAGINPDDISTMGYNHELMERIHYYLAKSSARLMLIQPEDMMQEHRPVNVPGTFKEHPNWQKKLPVSVTELLSQETQANFLKNVSIIRSSCLS